MTETAVVPDGKTRSRTLLLTLLAVVLLVGSGGSLFLGDASADEAPADIDGEIVTLEPLTTTVGQASLRHARITLAVVLTVDADPAVIDGRVALLQDALLREIAELDAEELRSADGTDRLRQRLSAEAQKIWGEDVVRRVVLTELLVQ